MTIKARIVALLFSLVCLGASVAHAEESKPLATCNDGTTMYSTTGNHRGACQGHKGVKAWASGEPVKSRNAKTTTYR